MSELTLPSHIGGYQHLEPDVTVDRADIFVLDGTPVAVCGDAWHGMKVGVAEEAAGCRAYRKMPAPSHAY